MNSEDRPSVDDLFSLAPKPVKSASSSIDNTVRMSWDEIIREFYTRPLSMYSQSYDTLHRETGGAIAAMVAAIL